MPTIRDLQNALDSGMISNRNIPILRDIIETYPDLLDYSPLGNVFDDSLNDYSKLNKYKDLQWRVENTYINQSLSSTSTALMPLIEKAFDDLSCSLCDMVKSIAPSIPGLSAPNGTPLEEHVSKINFTKQSLLPKRHKTSDDPLPDGTFEDVDVLGQYGNNEIDIDVDKIRKKYSDNERSIYIFTVLHEMMHALMDVGKSERNSLFTKTAEYSLTEEMLANAYALRIIKEYGDEQMLNDVKVFVKDQPEGYRDALVEYEKDDLLTMEKWRNYKKPR